MENPSLFSAIMRLTYDRSLYKAIGRKWGAGKLILFTFFIVLIVTVPSVLTTQLKWNSFIKSEGKEIIDQIPEITITNGHVSSSAELPFILDFDDELTFVIDTAGEFNVKTAEGRMILLNHNWLSIRDSNGSIDEYDLRSIESFSISSSKIYEWAGIVGKFLTPLLLLVVGFGSLIWQFVRALFFAVLGLIILSIKGEKVTFGRIYSVALIAGIPTLILSTVTGMIGVAIPGMGIVIFGVSCYYLWFGVTSLDNVYDDFENGEDVSKMAQHFS